MYRCLLVYVAMFKVLTYFGESIVIVPSDAVKCGRSIEHNYTNQSNRGWSLMCDITLNSSWTRQKYGMYERCSDVIPTWFFIVMASFQGALLLVLAGCLLVGWKYVTTQPKRDFVPDFVPSRSQLNDYTPNDDLYLEPSRMNQAKAAPCVALSVTRTDQETYDRVPVRGGSTNKRRESEAKTEPKGTVEDTSEEPYDFPSKIVRHV